MIILLFTIQIKIRVRVKPSSRPSIASVSLRARAVGARRENRAARVCCVFAEASVVLTGGKEAFKRIHALHWGKVVGFCGEKSAVAPVLVGRVQALITWS